MAETRKPGKAFGALAEGAERFDRLARTVKDSQLRRTKTSPGQPVTEVFELSPDDAWAKKYMTHCIGPVCYTVEAEPPVFAKFTAPPKASVQGGVVKAAAPQTVQSPLPRGQEVAGQAGPGPIGLTIGKPVRAGFRLGRLFGR
jgi:hypothetical protein